MIEALRPVAGSVRLVVARWLLSVLVALPGVLIGQGILAESVGSRPWFTEAPDPLPLPQFFAMMEEIGSLVPALLVGVGVGWIFLQLLTAAAVEILSPDRSAERVRLWRSMIDVGGRHFLTYLRITLFAFVILAIGARLISLLNGHFADRAEIEGWTLETTILLQPAMFALALLAWAGLVGIWAWWSRLVVARDGRRYVRRLIPVVPRLYWRYPVSGLLIHWLLSVLFVLVSAATLVAWRQAPGVATGWMLVWLLLLAVQAAVWHWRLRVMGLIWSDPRQDDLRARSDEPWRVVRRMGNRLRRKPRPEAERPEATGTVAAGSSTTVPPLPTPTLEEE